MPIKVLWSWELPQKINGIVVVADVWAATTNIALFLEKEVGSLIIVNKNTIPTIAKRFPDAVLVGESPELPANFFHHTNFTRELANVDFKGKTVLYMSNNGSRVIELAFDKGASAVITVSYVNFASVSRWLSKIKSQDIFLVAAGEITFDDQRVMEDYYCVEALADNLKGKKIDFEKIFSKSNEFLKKHYPGDYFESVDYKLIFNLNKWNTLASCSMDKGGLIRISERKR